MARAERDGRILAALLYLADAELCRDANGVAKVEKVSGARGHVSGDEAKTALKTAAETHNPN